jgi:hypothetical protein
MASLFKLFLAGMIQISMVAANTFFISKELYPWIIICSFMISFTWTWNIKKIVIGKMKDRIVYSLGATSGGIVGVLISKIVYNAV